MLRTSPLQRALATNSTASFATIIPRNTEPLGSKLGEVSTNGVYDLVHGGNGLVADWIKCMIFGAGADTNGVKFKLIGWSRIGTDPANTLWIPTQICSVTALLSTPIGIAGAKIINTDLFADAITVVEQSTFINDGTSVSGTIEVFSPADNTIAWLTAPLYGFEKIQFDFDKDAATNVNVAFRLIRA